LVNLVELILVFILVFIGIINSMVVDLLWINSVFFVFLEFVGDSVLVVYNVLFDIFFFKVVVVIIGHSWFFFDVVDIVYLVR